jgi:hypothetical protein
MSNCYCHPGKARGTSQDSSSARRDLCGGGQQWPSPTATYSCGGEAACVQSARVGNVRNNDPSLIEHIAAERVL